MVNFPSSFDNDVSLYVAVNNKRTNLTSSINAITLTIPVITTSGFPTAGFITILSDTTDITKAEAIKYTSVDATNFFASLRGAGATTARPHNIGDNVDLTIVADHHNELKDAIIQLEHFVGVSGAENFLRIDDFGNVSVPGSFTAPTGTFTTITGTTGRFLTSLTISGVPVQIKEVDEVEPAIIGDNFVSVVSGSNITKLFTKAIVAGNNITVTSGTNTITIASSNAPKALIGDNFVSVVSGTSVDNLYTKAIVAGSNITVTSGSNTVTIAASAGAGSGSKALIGDNFISVVSGTNVDNLYTKAITGADGVTVASGVNTVDLTGFRSEFVSASGYLQSQAVGAYLHTQVTPSVTWDIVHNLNTVFWDIQVYDTDNIVIGFDDAVALDEDNFRITFSVPLAGTAILLRAGGTAITVSGLAAVIQDPAPKLGGDLDVNTHSIISTPGQNVTFAVSSGDLIRSTVNSIAKLVVSGTGVGVDGNFVAGRGDFSTGLTVGTTAFVVSGTGGIGTISNVTANRGDFSTGLAVSGTSVNIRGAVRFVYAQETSATAYSETEANFTQMTGLSLNPAPNGTRRYKLNFTITGEAPNNNPDLTIRAYAGPTGNISAGNFRIQPNGWTCSAVETVSMAVTNFIFTPTSTQTKVGLSHEVSANPGATSVTASGCHFYVEEVQE